MKDNYKGSLGTLVVLMDALMLAIIIIGLFWYAGRSTVEASTGHNGASMRVDVRR